MRLRVLKCLLLLSFLPVGCAHESAPYAPTGTEAKAAPPNYQPPKAVKKAPKGSKHPGGASPTEP
jgi:hypothetical protein